MDALFSRTFRNSPNDTVSWKKPQQPTPDDVEICSADSRSILHFTKYFVENYEVVPHEHSADGPYHGEMTAYSLHPKVSWFLPCEIIDDTSSQMAFFRNRVEVIDMSKKHEFQISFYVCTPPTSFCVGPLENQPPAFADDPEFQYSDLVKGRVMLFAYPTRHSFMDGSAGIRVETVKYVRVLDCSLDEFRDICGMYPGQYVATESREFDHGEGFKLKWQFDLSNEALLRCKNPICENPATKRCRNCAMHRYCCRDCQIADWGTHKRICGVLQCMKKWVWGRQIFQDYFFDFEPF